MRQLLFLGTAAGMPIGSSSTSILLEEGDTNLLLDVSGGHNILGAFRAAGKDPLDIQNIFISHYDSDHFLGIVPLVRSFKSDPQKRRRTIFCSKEVMTAIETIFMFTAGTHFATAKKYIDFEII